MAKALMYQQLDFLRHLKRMHLIDKVQKGEARFQEVKLPIKTPKLKQER
jgi:hypothetical protein